MDTHLVIESFALPGAAVHVHRDGNASLLDAEAMGARLRRLPEGHLLGVFQISTCDELHPDTWEVHAGDEVLIMLTGGLDVEYSDGLRRGSSPLPTGHGMVMPKGIWHRLLLRQPGRLLVLSPPHGTRLSSMPGGSP